VSLSIQYNIDIADRIRFINEEGLPFAGQDAGARPNRASVAGKTLWECIEGEDIRQTYGMIFKAVRTKQQTAVLRFRCAGSACRRYFQLMVSSLPEEELRLSTHPICEVSRHPVSLVDSDARPGEPFLTIRSWCMKA